MVTNNETNSGACGPGPGAPQARPGPGPGPSAPQARAARSHPPHTRNRVDMNRRRSIF